MAKTSEAATYTVDEVAKFLGINRNFAYAAVHRGDIRSIKIGKRILIPKRALDELLCGAGAKSAA
jgi:excisionase family DNA binding protein